MGEEHMALSLRLRVRSILGELGVRAFEMLEC
jgi:hypothetical protein